MRTESYAVIANQCSHWCAPLRGFPLVTIHSYFCSKYFQILEYSAFRRKADCYQRPVNRQPQFPGNVVRQVERINCHRKVSTTREFLNPFCHRLFLSVKVFPCVFCLHSIQIPIFIFFNPECRKHQRFNIICQTVRFWGIWVGNAQDDTIITYSVYLLPCVFKIGSICNAVFM